MLKPCTPFAGRDFKSAYLNVGELSGQCNASRVMALWNPDPQALLLRPGLVADLRPLEKSSSLPIVCRVVSPVGEIALVYSDRQCVGRDNL
jgi:hypothetical protein